MMLLKVITIMLITICAADNQMLPDPQGVKELAKLRLSRHIIYPINKITKYEQYTTPSSFMGVNGAASPNVFQKLQYAPLHERINQKIKSIAAEYITLTAPSADTTESTDLTLDKKSKFSFGKSHLEPRDVVPDKKCYAADSTSVSRSPGHNAVYRKIIEITQNELELPSKINDNVRPSGINVNMKPIGSTFTPLLELPKMEDMPLSLTDHDFVLNPVNPAPPTQGKTKRQFIPLTKYHRLHLNIARVYSPGQVHGPKPPPFSNPASGNFDMIGLPAYPDQETALYPVKQHLGYQLRYT